MNSVIGFILLGLGALIAFANIYLSLLRYPLHRLRGGTRESYHWVSGIPAIGTLLLWGSAFLLRQHHAWVWLAIALSIFDTAGLPCFIATMLYMSVRAIFLTDH